VRGGTKQIERRDGGRAARPLEVENVIHEVWSRPRYCSPDQELPCHFSAGGEGEEPEMRLCIFITSAIQQSPGDPLGFTGERISRRWYNNLD
jgi:hypothetical protein